MYKLIILFCCVLGLHKFATLVGAISQKFEETLTILKNLINNLDSDNPKRLKKESHHDVEFRVSCKCSGLYRSLNQVMIFLWYLDKKCF